MSWQKSVILQLEKETKTSIELYSTSSVGGGDINDAYQFKTSRGNFFIKKNSASKYPQMFQKEASGLELLYTAKEIKVPEVVVHGVYNDTAYLVLRFIKSGLKANNFWEDFGKQLANLHKHSNNYFGLVHDNYIGSLYQSNSNHDTWSEFFSEERLEKQVKLARDNGEIGGDTMNAFSRFYKRLDELFPVEPPALVHGDLWSGNYMIDQNGEAIIIDPAVYYGHREMDIGMSKLFGGFKATFYEAYNEQYPLEKGWQERVDYCNLYPLMVHVNLFGGGYLNSVKSILHRF